MKGRLCWRRLLEIDATEKMASEISQSITRTIKQRKEGENTRFNEIRQFAYILGEREESSYRINQLQVAGFGIRDTNIGDTTSPYIVKEITKKRTPKIPNSDQKRIQNQI